MRNKIAAGRLDRHHLLYAGRTDEASAQEALLLHQEQLSTLRRTAALLRSHPVYQVPEHTVAAILRVLEQTDASIGGSIANLSVHDFPSRVGEATQFDCAEDSNKEGNRATFTSPLTVEVSHWGAPGSN